MISAPSAPPPQPPPPPPNPPMFMQTPSQAGAKEGAQVGTKGFGGTILGLANPANTGQKTLLGQ